MNMTHFAIAVLPLGIVEFLGEWLFPQTMHLKKYFEYFLPCDDGNFFQSNLSYL